MFMKELLSELKQEVSHISSKSLGPIDFDYRRRTKLERLLFLLAKEYCKAKFNYNLGGLGYSHRNMFLDSAKSYSWSSTDVETVTEAFKISELICDLSSSDPYAREEAMEELGGSIYAMFKSLADRIGTFISNVEDSYAVG